MLRVLQQRELQFHSLRALARGAVFGNSNAFTRLQNHVSALLHNAFTRLQNHVSALLNNALIAVFGVRVAVRSETVQEILSKQRNVA